MKIVRESLNEFHQTGDPIGSLNIGVSASLRKFMYHANIIEDSLKEFFEKDYFRDIAGNDTSEEIILKHFPEKLDNNSKYIRYEFALFNKIYYLGYNISDNEYFVGAGMKHYNTFMLDEERDGYNEINLCINKLLSWIRVYKEKTNLYEFHQTGDPLNSLGLGITHMQIEFKTVDEFTDFIIKYSNIILNKPIPEKNDSSALMPPSIFDQIVLFFYKHDNFKFYGLDNNFSKKNKGSDENDKDWKSWVYNLVTKYQKLGYLL